MRVLVRLACVKPAASVRSEPGSNSQVERWPSLPGNKSQMQTALNSGTHIEHLSQGLTTLRHMQDAQCFGAICTAACASLHHLHFQTAHYALRHYLAVERHFIPLSTETPRRDATYTASRAPLSTSLNMEILPKGVERQEQQIQPNNRRHSSHSLLIKHSLSLFMGDGISFRFPINKN